MKRWPYFLLGVVLLAGVFWSQNQTHLKNAAALTATTVKVNTPVASLVAARLPSAPTLALRPNPIMANRSPANYRQRKRPQPIAGVTIGKNPIRIGKSFNLVEGVVTLEKAKYQEIMGKKIYEDDKYVFFAPVSPKTEAFPVALNSSNQKLYPISHVLHVNGVDAELREQFKAEGMQEFYYHSRLKLIFLEASPSTVMKQFKKLSAQGFDVRLEVIKENPKAI